MSTIEEKIANISALHFPDRKMVKRMVASCELAGAIIDMDKNGFFAHSFTMPDWLADMPTQAEVEARRAAMGEQPAKEKKAPVRVAKGGACDLIRAWARENPNATPAEGVAHFPALNPSTVKIQMRKVRLGQV